MGYVSETKLLPLLTWRSAVCASSLAPTTRHVALTLSLWMNEMGASAYPGATAMADATGLSVRAVREHLNALVEAGWLELVERGGIKGDRRRANEYRAAIPAPTVTGDAALPVTMNAVTGDPDDTDPASSVTPSLQDLFSDLSSRPRTTKKPRTTGHRIPDEFTVTDQMVAWAEREAPDVNLGVETQIFVSHWKAASGQNASKLDWKKAWETWFLKEQKTESRRKSFGPAGRR